jgi:hypothetical protein
MWVNMVHYTGLGEWGMPEDTPPPYLIIMIIYSTLSFSLYGDLSSEDHRDRVELGHNSVLL